MNEGVSTELGIPVRRPWPRRDGARDILLAELTGAHVHIATSRRPARCGSSVTRRRAASGSPPRSPHIT